MSPPRRHPTNRNPAPEAPTTDTPIWSWTLDKAAYFGFSFGGIITTNLTNRYTTLGLPAPRAIFLDDPHDGGLEGAGEPAVDASLAGIPATVKFVCHSSAKGMISIRGKEN